MKGHYVCTLRKVSDEADAMLPGRGKLIEEQVQVGEQAARVHAQQDWSWIDPVPRENLNLRHSMKDLRPMTPTMFFSVGPLLWNCTGDILYLFEYSTRPAGHGASLLDVVGLLNVGKAT
ncbi:hypothetical protein EDB85DRAFT_1892973 [Lactarius pseudohatsudake]|nr:hypothetical protein EDB85DRAFT_1892973 [Lactarius pseudohatsudake]